jgi:hypothetical protein
MMKANEHHEKPFDLRKDADQAIAEDAKKRMIELKDQ